jgi:hypothetical protein
MLSKIYYQPSNYFPTLWAFFFFDFLLYYIVFGFCVDNGGKGKINKQTY